MTHDVQVHTIQPHFRVLLSHEQLSYERWVCISNGWQCRQKVTITQITLLDVIRLDIVLIRGWENTIPRRLESFFNFDPCIHKVSSNHNHRSCCATNFCKRIESTPIQGNLYHRTSPRDSSLLEPWRDTNHVSLHKQVAGNLSNYLCSEFRAQVLLRPKINLENCSLMRAI